MSSLLTYIDTYAISHLEMYPPVLSASAYLTFRRRPRNSETDSPKIVWYGLSYLLETALSAPLSKEDIDEFLWQSETVYGKPIKSDIADLFQRIPTYYAGYLPIRIYALPEGTAVQPGVPLLRVDADAQYAGFVTLLEGLLVQTWYASLVATRCSDLRTIIDGFARQSVPRHKRDDYVSVSVMDWSFRSSSSRESAMLSGLAYNLFFSGVAKFCVASRPDVRKAINDLPRAIKATSHSVVLAHQSESGFIEHISKIASDNELIEIVIDTFDSGTFIENHLPALIKLRDVRGIKFLLAPDSGNQSIQMLRLLNECEKIAGSSVNELGYKTLNGISIVLGDEMNNDKIIDALIKCMASGFSVENVFFGLGSAISQRAISRDDLSASFQLSEITDLGGNYIPVRKGVPGFDAKASLSGRLGVDSEGNTLDLRTGDAGKDNLLLVYDGQSQTPVTIECYDIIRNRAMSLHRAV